MNIKRLEIYWPRNKHLNYRIHHFNFREFVSNRFENLKYLILGDNIRYHFGEENLNILKRLKYFNVNVEFDLYKNSNGESRNSYDLIVEIAGFVNLIDIGRNDESLLLHRKRVNDVHVKRVALFSLAKNKDSYFERNLYKKLYKLKFVNSRFNVDLIENLKIIDLKAAVNLVELNLGHVHLHLSNGNGNELVGLKCIFFTIIR